MFILLNTNGYLTLLGLLITYMIIHKRIPQKFSKMERKFSQNYIGRLPHCVGSAYAIAYVR